MKKVMQWLVVPTVCGLMAFAGLPRLAGETLPRVLVVTGGHDYPTTFYSLFDDPSQFQWDHATSNHEAFRSDLRGKYDVLVLYDSSTEISETERKNLADFV